MTGSLNNNNLVRPDSNFGNSVKFYDIVTLV